MLAKTELTAEELGITVAEQNALRQVMYALRTGEIQSHEFDMAHWDKCICGHAQRIGGNNVFYSYSEARAKKVGSLFMYCEKPHDTLYHADRIERFLATAA